MAKKNKIDLNAAEAGKQLQEAVRQLVKYRVSLDPSIITEKGGVNVLQKNIRKFGRLSAKG